MKPISNTNIYGATIARAYVGSVLPDSAITFDRNGDGSRYLYAFLGTDGPAVSATWDGGRYVTGRVGKQEFRTQQGFLNATMRATARP